MNPYGKARSRTQYIVVHCSATRPSSDIGADEIDDWHRRRGWDSIGYMEVIRRDGTIEYGRHFDAIGAHVKGQNYRSVGICLAGGLREDGTPGERFDEVFTKDQEMSLLWSLIVLERAYPGAEIVGHRDLSPDADGDGVVEEHEWLKECPCFDVGEWWNGIMCNDFIRCRP